MTGPYPSAAEAYPRLRQSVLSSFASCALSAKLAMDYPASSHRAAGGTLFHRTVAKLLGILEQTGEVQIEDVDLAMDVFEEVMRQADVPMVADGLGEEDVQVSPRELADMRVCVRQWCRQLAWDPQAIAAVERREDVTVTYPDGDGGVVERVVTTQLDCLTIDASGEYAESWDWKTSQSPPSKKERDPEAFDDSDASDEGYFQQQVHALVIFMTRPRVQTVRCVEYYPRAPKDPTRERTFHRYELEVLFRTIASYVERFDRAFEEGVWRPLAGTHCSYCVAQSKCTLFKAARGAGQVTSYEEAVTAMEHEQFLSGFAKTKREAVRAWSRANGGRPVPVRHPKVPKAYGPVETPDGVRFRLHNADVKHPHELAIEAEVRRMVEHAPG